MSRIPKTILRIEVNDNEYNVRYNGQIKYDPDKTARKHDERLMRMLMADDDLLNFFYSIVTPVIRFKRREARRNAQQRDNIESTSRE